MSVNTAGIIILAADAVLFAWLIIDGIRLGRRSRVVPPVRPAERDDPSAGSHHSVGAGRPGSLATRRARDGAATNRVAGASGDAAREQTRFDSGPAAPISPASYPAGEAPHPGTAARVGTTISGCEA